MSKGTRAWDGESVGAALVMALGRWWVPGMRTWSMGGLVGGEEVLWVVDGG